MTTFGTYLKPFSEDSPWNVFPINPTLGTYSLPTNVYNPIITAGEFSTGVFLATSAHSPMTVYPLSGKTGVWEPDSARNLPTVTLPHWPTDTVPATGTDGHCDIVDETTGIIHSFWQLKIQNNRWCAAQYAWAKIDGRGFGDPCHYYQGARAAGVPTMAGLIRKHEANDGDVMYRHALCMSLPYEALGSSYICPATSTDNDAASTNTGGIHDGSLLILPPNYDTSGIANVALKKVAETLKVYGAYVVDRNYGTPYFIYVEEGAGVSIAASGTYDPVYTELHRIRTSLRQVTNASAWGVTKEASTPLIPKPGQNLLSLRGTWTPRSGSAVATYNPIDNSLDFPAGPQIVMNNSDGLGLNKVLWSRLNIGDKVRFSVSATDGGLGRMQVMSGNTLVHDTSALGDGGSDEFILPTGFWYKLLAANPTNLASKVTMNLVKV